MHFINGFCASNGTDVFIIILNDGCCRGVRAGGGWQSEIKQSLVCFGVVYHKNI